MNNGIDSFFADRKAYNKSATLRELGVPFMSVAQKNKTHAYLRLMEYIERHHAQTNQMLERVSFDEARLVVTIDGRAFQVDSELVKAWCKPVLCYLNTAPIHKTVLAQSIDSKVNVEIFRYIEDGRHVFIKPSFFFAVLEKLIRWYGFDVDRLPHKQ
jgi:hypothetical protein